MLSQEYMGRILEIAYHFHINSLRAIFSITDISQASISFVFTVIGERKSMIAHPRASTNISQHNHDGHGHTTE